VEGELDCQLAARRIEAPGRVVAAHELARLVLEHELHVIVERHGDEVDERNTRESDRDEVRADRLHPRNLHGASPNFVADPLHTTHWNERFHLRLLLVDNVIHDG
jgi:hypothetical protein